MSTERQPLSLHRPRERARWAWEQVKNIGGLDDKRVEARYHTLVRKLPSLLQGSGLGQTLAFLFSKRGQGGQAPEGRLLGQLAQWILPRERQRDPMRDMETLMEELVKMSPALYRHHSRELLIVAEWLKRFADGLLVAADESGD
jgi:CRISPR-associated protein Cmr5